MPRSTVTAEPTAVQSKPQGPSSSRDQGYPAGASRDNTAGPAGATGLNNPGPAPNSPMSELAQLMEEPAGGPNSGRRASDNPDVEGRHVPLGADEWQAAEFMRGGGWGVVETSRGSGGATPGARDAGMTAHRGVLHSEDYVDTDALRAQVEAELGFTYEQIRSVYRQGRLSADQRELRGSIDARLLALSRAGGNLALLGGALGFKVESDSHCEPMDNAVARARKAELAEIEEDN